MTLLKYLRIATTMLELLRIVTDSAVHVSPEWALETVCE